MSKVLKLRNGESDVAKESKAIPVQPVSPFIVITDHVEEAAELSTVEDTQQLWIAAKAQCDQMRADAQKMLEETQRLAEVQVQRTLEEARQEGFEAGFAQGMASAEEACRADCHVRVAHAEAVLHHAQAERQRFVKDMYVPLVTVCTEAVRTILHRELELKPAEVERMVSGLLQYVTESTKVEVRVHPSDFQAATDAHPVWQSAKFGDWDVIVVPDTNISVGGCEIRSESGRVDATLETKLELLQAVLMTFMERGVAQYAAADD